MGEDSEDLVEVAIFEMSTPRKDFFESVTLPSLRYIYLQGPHVDDEAIRSFVNRHPLLQEAEVFSKHLRTQRSVEQFHPALHQDPFILPSAQYLAAPIRWLPHLRAAVDTLTSLTLYGEPIEELGNTDILSCLQHFTAL